MYTNDRMNSSVERYTQAFINLLIIAFKILFIHCMRVVVGVVCLGGVWRGSECGRVR